MNIKELFEAKRKKKREKGSTTVNVTAYDNTVDQRMLIPVKCDKKDASKLRRVVIRKPARTDRELYVMSIDGNSVLGREHGYGRNRGKILPAFVLNIEDPDAIFGYVNGDMTDVRRTNLRRRDIMR